MQVFVISLDKLEVPKPKPYIKEKL